MARGERLDVGGLARLSSGSSDFSQCLNETHKHARSVGEIVVLCGGACSSDCPPNMASLLHDKLLFQPRSNARESDGGRIAA